MLLFVSVSGVTPCISQDPQKVYHVAGGITNVHFGVVSHDSGAKPQVYHVALCHVTRGGG